MPLGLLDAHRIRHRAVIRDSGRIVAEGPMDDVLGDTALLTRHT